MVTKTTSKKQVTQPEKVERTRTAKDPVVEAVRQYLNELTMPEKLAFAMGLVLLGAEGHCNNSVPHGFYDLANDYKREYMEEIEATAVRYISGDTASESCPFKNQSDYQIMTVLVTMVHNFS